MLYVPRPVRAKPGGWLSGGHSVELFATVLGALAERNDLDTGRVDDVMPGCVGQAGEHWAQC
jgi:acetyl-CoA acyltransferase